MIPTSHFHHSTTHSAFHTSLTRLLLGCSLLATVTTVRGQEEIPDATQRVKTLNGLTRILPRYSTEGVANRWPSEYEQAYLKRVSDQIPLYKGKSSVNTTGEREKYDYPMTVGAWLAGDRAAAIKVLEQEDIDGNDHAWTKGIDLYWGFTLKAQALKFFYLEDQLTPAYRERMLEAFRIFTEKDPRPTLEYALNTESADPEVAAFATAQLAKMWRSRDEAKAMAEKAISEKHPNKVRFGNYILGILDRWPEQQPATPEEWQAWWALIAAGDWMVFEEYERRANPHPHPRYGTGTGPVGATWNPSVRGMKADARNTDNLRGMRESAIYLFAERSGNELLRKLYKDRIRRTALGFWEVGNGEWDSDGYHPHTICAYMNLYAFARDPEVRGMSKAILDFLFTAGSVKYYRGAWTGPNKRDYGNFKPMRAVGQLLWLYYGDTPLTPGNHIADNVWPIISDYRPPAALVAFAQKDFAKPLEMFNTHPTYSNWLPGQAERPNAFETMYYGNSFTLGTLGRGSRGDVSGFRLATRDSKKGAAIAVGGTGATKRLHTGSGQDRIGQYRNLVLLLAPGQVSKKGKTQPNKAHFSIPPGGQVEQTGEVTFIKTESAWVALIPVGGAPFQQGSARIGKGNKASAIGMLSTESTGGSAFGFALEVGEAETHGSYEDFKKAIRSKAKIALHDQGAALTASDGRQLKVSTPDRGLPQVERDGELHDWGQHVDVYHSVDSNALNLPRGKRILEVNAGGHSFRGELKEDGTYNWTETLKGE